jgi:hypothetical protein
MPATAGIQKILKAWIPACAGMTSQWGFDSRRSNNPVSFRAETPVHTQNKMAAPEGDHFEKL